MSKTFRMPEVSSARLPVMVTDYKTDKDLNVLVNNAREQFLNMQNSWWNFAKIIYQIRETEAFRAVADTFKDYCNKEFPTMSYETLTKFCHIVESFQDTIDHRIEKNPDYSLPAYESCYRLTTLKPEIVPKEEISKLKKSVLDGKMTYASLKERIREVMSKAKEKVMRDVETRAEKVEEQLLKDLGDEGFYGEDDSIYDGIADTDTSHIDSEVDDEETTTVSNRNLKNIISGINIKMAYIKDNLPHVTNNLERLKITDELIEFAEDLQESSIVIEEFLEKLGEVSDV